MRLTILTLLCFLCSASLSAQQVDIVAFVNEDVITAHDLEQQIKIFRLIGALPKDVPLNKNVQRQVLDVLVTIRLKLQLIRESNTRIDNSLLQREYDGFAQRAKISKNEIPVFLKREGISENSLRQFIISNVIWEHYIRRFAFRFFPSQSEVSTQYQQALNQLSQTSYQLYEILLPVNSILDDNIKRQQAQDVIAELINGADFRAIASNISSAASANRGGLRGWVVESELSDEERTIIQTMSINSLTDRPIRTRQGYVIYWLRNKKQPDSSYRQILDYQRHLFAGDNKGQVRANNYRQQKNEPACSDKKISGTIETQSFENILAQDIETDMQKHLALLVESEKSNVFFYQGNWAVLGLCQRQEIGQSPINRIQVRDRIIFDRLSEFGVQHLQEKLRESYIEVILL